MGRPGYALCDFVADPHSVILLAGRAGWSAPSAEGTDMSWRPGRDRRLFYNEDGPAGQNTWFSRTAKMNHMPAAWSSILSPTHGLEVQPESESPIKPRCCDQW